MLYWDKVIDENRVKDRMKQLSYAKAAVYVLGCVSHAHEILSRGDSKPSPEFLMLSEPLARFWQEYPHSLESPFLDVLGDEVEKLLPEDEDQGCDVETLTWGVLYAFSAIRRQFYGMDTANSAISAVDRAYWSVFALYSKDEDARNEDQIRAVEMSNTGCRAEIEFQLAFLAALEASEDDPPPTYATVVRCILGNPFHPVTVDPAWQTSTVVSLAQAAYENRTLPAGTLEPARLAVLADALEEAGCNNIDILNHCRQPGKHVRGCWVLDLILGKS